MIFPHHPRRARAFAAWLIMRVAGESSSFRAELEDANTKQELIDIACAAADFAYCYEEAQQNGADSIRAGIIVGILWGLICSNPSTASWQAAIEEAQTRTTSRNKGLPATEPLFRDCLKNFQPVLHLLGARFLRRPALRPQGNIVDLTSDSSVGYSRNIDLLFFAAEANALQEHLRAWDQRRPQRSPNLDGRMFELDASWNPPPKQSGWPDTGRLKRRLLEPGFRTEAAPTRQAAENPLNLISESFSASDPLLPEVTN